MTDAEYYEQEMNKYIEENEKLKKRLTLADGLIKKAKELTDFYQEQIERYEKVLKISQTQK